MPQYENKPQRQLVRVVVSSAYFRRSTNYLACTMKNAIEVYLYFYRFYRFYEIGVIRSAYRAIKKVIL